MKKRPVISLLAAAAAATAFAVTGCAGGGAQPIVTATTTVTSTPSASAGGTSASSGAPTGTGTGTPNTGPTPTSSGQVDPNAPEGQCADSALAVTVTPSEGGAAAGSVFFDVAFTNTGGASCNLRGAPGVSVVGDANGTQLGNPATQSADTVTTVALAPGQTVSAPLQQVNIGTDGGPLAGNCTIVTGDGYRVYPPHSFAAYFVPFPGITACSNAVDWMTVGAVASP